MYSCPRGMQNNSKTHTYISVHSIRYIYIYMHILYIYIDNNLTYKKESKIQKKELTRTQSGQDLVAGSRA